MMTAFYKYIFIASILLFTSTLSAQSWKWALSSDYKTPLGNGEGYTNAEGITVVGGSYMDSIKIGNTRLVNKGSGKFFVAVIDPAGNVITCFSDGESFPELEPVAYGSISNIFLDKDHNIFIAGLGTHEIKFGNQTYTAAANTQSFIAKYTYSGTLLWVKTFSSPGYYNTEQMTDFKIDEDGNIYCTGVFREGNLNLTNTILTSSCGQNAYLIKYNAAGELQWAQAPTVSPRTNDVGGCAARSLLLHENKIYWFGQYATDMTLQNHTLTGDYSEFMACLTNDGTLSWIKSVDGYMETNMIYGDSMIVAGVYNQGDKTLLGEHLNDASLYLMAYDLDGNGKWAKQIVYPDLNSVVFSYCDVQSLFMDKDNDICAGGRLAGDLTIGTTAITTVNNSSDLFYLKSNANDGTINQFVTTGSNRTEYPWSMGIDQCGNYYFTGIYVDSTVFGDHKLVNDQTPSVFAAQFENNPDCLLPMAINTPSVMNVVTLYPNPAQQALNIVFPAQPKEEVTVIIYNEMGKMESIQLYEVNGTHLELPIRLVSGLYLVKVISAEQTYTAKLVVE